MSGTSAYFDVTGVMWIIAFFYIMGHRFFWVQWEWGFVAVVGCFAAFMGKWLQRSRVVTGAEWMVIRFGDGAAGRFARSAYAVLAVVVAVAFAGFAEYGGGQFLHAFLPQYVDIYFARQLVFERLGEARDKRPQGGRGCHGTDRHGHGGDLPVHP